MSNIVKATGLSIEALEEADRIVESIAGSIYLDVPEGTTVVRVLPASLGRSSPFRVTAQHYVDAVPGLDRMVVFACPRVELKQPCVGCQKVEELQKTGNPIDRDRAYKMSAGLRVFANVIDRSRPDLGVRAWGFGKMIWDQLKTIRKNVRLGGDFTDPTEAGFDLVITRVGTERQTKYTVAADRQNSALAVTQEEIDAIMSGAHDLDALVNPTPPDELILAWGQAIRQQTSVSAAVSAQRSVAGARALPSQSSAQVVSAPQSRTGASVMASVKNSSPAKSAVQDAVDTKWMDE